jgi:hypothetical protein
MRYIFYIFMCLILLSNKSYSQQNLQITRLNNSCDTLVVKTWVWFSFGYQSTCPQLSYFETVSNSDTMELKLFYNVSGAWPQVECERTDTITSVIPSNMTVLRCIAYSINDNDTTIESTMQMPICSPTGIESIDNYSFYSLFPNPFSTQLNFQLSDSEQTTVTLYDFFGRQIMQQKVSNSAIIITEQLPSGIYIYELRNDKGTFKNGKIIKNY